MWKRAGSTVRREAYALRGKVSIAVKTEGVRQH